MQTSLLPISCCDEIDKCSRGFLWGSTSEGKKMHLVGWDCVCTEKKMGGLGLRHSKQQNQAFLMKLGWGMITNREALWVRVIRGKYRCGEDLLPNIDQKWKGSRVWRGIKNTWETVKRGVEVVERRNMKVARWKHESHGVFSVKSAYCALEGDCISSSNMWAKIWKLKIPQRCKTNLWLTMHGRLLTNEVKFKCGLHPNGECDACNGVTEDVLHVLRDCQLARRVWDQIGMPKKVQRIISNDLQVWVGENLKVCTKNEAGRWCDIFGIICWILWKKRNDRVFNNVQTNTSACLAEVKAILRYMQKGQRVVARNDNNANVRMHKPERLLWEQGWDKVFVDGAYSHMNEAAGCGGFIVRDGGKWLDAFMFRMYEGDSLTAELWGCLMGLKRAWDLGLHKIIVFNDSREAVNLIQNEGSELHKDYELVTEIKGMFARSWMVKLEVIDREFNGAADKLAKQSLGQGFGLHVIGEQFMHELVRDYEPP